VLFIPRHSRILHPCHIVPQISLPHFYPRLCDRVAFSTHSFTVVPHGISVAKSVHHLPAHMREDAHAIGQLQCQWHSGPWLVKWTISKRCYISSVLLYAHATDKLAAVPLRTFSPRPLRSGLCDGSIIIWSNYWGVAWLTIRAMLCERCARAPTKSTSNHVVLVSKLDALNMRL